MTKKYIKKKSIKESIGTIEYMIYEGAPIFQEEIKKVAKNKRKK